MVELIEKAITIPDEKKEVMEMCLASPETGDFKPISLPTLYPKMDPITPSNSPLHTGGFGSFRASPQVGQVGQKHIPGKAGGGWEDDEEDQKHQISYCPSHSTMESR